MRVGDPANCFGTFSWSCFSERPLKGAIERGVGLGIGRGTQVSLDQLAGEVDDNHVSCGERLVGNTAWLDGEDAARPIKSRDVAERVDRKTTARDLHVRAP